jgi:SH3-like domain-containing protein
MEREIIRHLVKVKNVVCLIVSFLCLVLFVATNTAAEASLLADKLETAEASTSDTISLTSMSRIGVLNADMVNIRQGPGLNEKIIGRKTRKGTVFMVLGHEGDWVMVYTKGLLGWIYGKYLNIEEGEVVPVTKATAPVLTGQQTNDEPQKPLTGYEQTLQKIMDLVFVFLESIEKRKDLGMEEKKQISTDYIRRIRWGPEIKNYFRINGLDGSMVMEPLYPHTEGKNCTIFKDLNDKEIFVEFIRTSREKGQGFVDHHGLGYDDNKSNPRVSLVRLFDPWGWVIGTSIDLDAVEAYKDPEKVKLYFPLPPIDEELPIDDEGPASPA